MSELMGLGVQVQLAVTYMLDVWKPLWRKIFSLMGCQMVLVFYFYCYCYYFMSLRLSLTVHWHRRLFSVHFFNFFNGIFNMHAQYKQCLTHFFVSYVSHR